MAELLERLSQARGVSGCEGDVRGIITDEIKNICDEITVDSMGNVIALKKGEDPSKRIVVIANMDEAGLIISGITEKGFLKFKLVGNIDPRKLVSKRVLIGEDRVKGVIGMKAIHLQTKDERENVVGADKLFIDIGENDLKSAEKRVKKGDYVMFDTSFENIGERVKGKALGRSASCAALVKALRGSFKYDVYACFTVQKEVGARGAQIVSRRIAPDASLTVWAAETSDMYGCKEIGGCSLGKGAAIDVFDKSAVADRYVTDALSREAEMEEINIQKCVLTPYSSGMGAFQTAGDGTVCVSAAIPCRYECSPVSLMSLSDIDAVTDYISLFLRKIGDMI